MDANMELLDSIYQNSEMGILATRELLEASKDSRFRDHLSTQLEEYRAINDEARQLIDEKGARTKELNPIAQATSRFTINAKTLMDSSTSHMAEMMMQGSTMGIVDATKNLRRYSHAEKPIRSLAEKLLRTEESNVEHIKEFLS
jgi:hypothetical protein